MPTGFVDVNALAQNWWAILLRGTAAVLFGVATFVAPRLSVTALVMLFGAYAVTDGTLSIVSVLHRRGRTETWWALLLCGIAGVAAGLFTIFRTDATWLALLDWIATWALVVGVLQMIAAVRLRKGIEDEWFLGVAGLACVGLALLVMFLPGRGALALVLWIGAYVFAYGFILLAFALRLRAWAKLHHPPQTGHGAPGIP